MEDLIIIGAGGLGREVEWMINRINSVGERKQWNLLGYADDTMEINTKVGKSKVCCNIQELENIDKKINVVIAIGNSQARKNIYEELKKNSNIKYPNIIDPNAILGDVELGIGNIICAGVIATVNIKLGNFILINLSCTIGHDDILGNFTTINPSVNISGNVETGECIEIGTGTQIIQKKKICSNVIIGAGAVIVKDIVEEGTYIGVPAQKK